MMMKRKRNGKVKMKGKEKGKGKEEWRKKKQVKKTIRTEPQLAVELKQREMSQKKGEGEAEQEKRQALVHTLMEMLVSIIQTLSLWEPAKQKEVAEETPFLKMLILTMKVSQITEDRGKWGNQRMGKGRLRAERGKMRW
jgi:hypothetical protein